MHNDCTHPVGCYALPGYHLAHSESKHLSCAALAGLRCLWYDSCTRKTPTLHDARSARRSRCGSAHFACHHCRRLSAVLDSHASAFMISTTTRHRVMVAPQRHDVHQGHASESHGFAPVAPVRVTVRRRGKPPRSHIGGEMLSHASHDAAPPTHKYHGRDTSEYAPVSEMRNLVGVLGSYKRHLKG